MTEPVQDKIGHVLSDRYELLEPLGKGGMAVVWLGEQRGSDGFRRQVAIKRIEPTCRAFPEVVDMFIEEARVGGLLRHPNIVQVYDFGVDQDGERYLVSELIRGPHLGQWVASFGQKNQLPPWEVVSAIAVEVLRALDAAHLHLDRHGKVSPILHRDVTPANILLDWTGVVKLADFGLARATDRGQITRPNVVKGKLSYLAPELFQGGAASTASDLFSFGVVLWEALTAKRLYQADTDLGVVRLIQEGRPALLSRERPNLPLGLCNAVHRCLERDPLRRFPSARAMLEELTGLLRVLPRSVDSRALAESIRGTGFGA